MKTITITAESGLELDKAIDEQIEEFAREAKEKHLQIAVIAISFSTHVIDSKAVYCSQISYVQQSKFAIGQIPGNMAQA